MSDPYEVTDYARSYLGDSKDSREFAKQFLEKRSYYKNKAKNAGGEVIKKLSLRIDDVVVELPLHDFLKFGAIGSLDSFSDICGLINSYE